MTLALHAPTTSSPLDTIKTTLTVLNPVRFLRAIEQYYKFCSLDIATLKDVGLTQQDVAAASLSDFLKASRS